MRRLGMVLGVLGIVLVLVGFLGPWWTVGISATIGGQTFSSAADFRLFGGTATVTGPGVSQTNTTDYSTDPNTRSVFLVGAALSGLAMAFGVGLVVLGTMAASRPSYRRLASMCGIIAFALALFGTLYVMGALPGAVNQDSGADVGVPQISGFWGTSSTSILGFSASVVWAAGWAWYVVLCGAVVFLIGGIVAILRPMRAPAMPLATPSPPLESPPVP